MIRILLILVVLFETFQSKKNGIWILADLHVDTKYIEGAESDRQACSDEDLCCRNLTSSVVRPAGKYGQLYANCDIPIDTVNGVLDFITKNDQQYPSDLVLSLGDYSPHDTFTESAGENIESVKQVFGLFENYFSSKGKLPKKVVAIPGDHESYPCFQVCKPSSFLHKSCYDWMYKPFGDLLGIWENSKTVDFFKKTGYYSTTQGKLRIIAVNTQWVTPLNLFNLVKMDNDMKDWLIEELKACREKGEKAIILAHIPNNNYVFVQVFPDWHRAFIDVIKAYSDVILATFNGHLHLDMFYITRDENNKPISTSFIVPAVDTRQNPVIKYLEYDDSTLEIGDITTFICDINKANKEGNMDFCWQIEYSMKSSFGMPNLSPQSFDELSLKFYDDKQDSWKKYYKFYSRGGPIATLENYPAPTKNELICCTRYTDFEKYYSCTNKTII